MLVTYIETSIAIMGRGPGVGQVLLSSGFVVLKGMD